MKVSLNIKGIKRCAFCKYWYDPTNSVISPKNSKIGIWEIVDTDKKSKCLKTNQNMRAGSFCSQNFQSKL